jgi:hypothetical protein
MRNDSWDSFEDILAWFKGEDKSKVTLRRKYLKKHGDRWDWLEEYTSNPNLAPIVAKGISAFLAYEESTQIFGYSIRYKIRHNQKFDWVTEYKTYFNLCFNYLNSKEERLLPPKRRTKEELISFHIQIEEALFNESQQLYNEIMPKEAETIQEIKEAAIYYREWVREENKITESQTTSEPKNKPTANEIALFYYYQGKTITLDNVAEIAKKHGFKGVKLYNLYTAYLNNNDRKAAPTNNTKVTFKNKIKLFENVIEMLETKDKQKALTELNILRNLYKSDHQ